MKSIHYYFFLLILCPLIAYPQGAPQGINYQGIAADASGQPVVNKAIGVKISIYSASSNGILQWEETHAPFCNQFGLFALVVGQGTTTGNGTSTSFATIDWGNAAHYLKVSIDINGGSNYIDISNTQLLAVPYAFYSAKAGQVIKPVYIGELTDVDTIGVSTGDVLKWSGQKWKPGKDNDSDTARFSYSSYKAVLADTALYSKNNILSDTADFAFKADSALFAIAGDSAIQSIHAIYSDTATYALNCVTITNDWHITGNTSIATATDFIGTVNNADFVVKTDNTERMRVTAAGKLGIGITNPISAVHIVGNDGLIAQGTFGSGVAQNLGAGSRMMWYPRKAAFRAGYVTAAQWDDANIGAYSFASGYASTARGIGAVAMGRLSSASDSCGVAMGYAAVASGKYAVALGNVPNASGQGAVAIGRGAAASGFAAQGIGYHVTASGNYATAFGQYSVASGENSVTMGYHANSNNMKGSFVYSDYSSTTVFATATAPNQFMVKAAGGTIFYSNSTLTTGVSLPAGGGAWQTLSDKHKKEHFRKVNAETILKKIADIEINSWNYKSQSEDIRHIGPMAQDFYAAFGFGENNTTITTTDLDGVNLIAIQALAKRTKELNDKIKELENMKMKFNELEIQKKSLEKRLDNIEKKLSEN